MSYLNRWVPNQFFMTVIIVLICVVFIFLSGTGADFLPSNNAGKINGETVTLSEFQQAYNRLHEQYGQQFKDSEALKRLPLHDFAFNQLVGRKVLLQAAKKYDLMASEEAVRDYIRKMPAFQTDGRFSKLTYEDTLKANGLSFQDFEEDIRNFLTTEHIRNFFQEAMRVSSQELEREYLLRNEKRKVKFVYLKFEHGQKDVKITNKEVDEYLADANKLAVAQARFDARKARDFADKTFDQSKHQIVREILASQKVDEIQKSIQSMAEQVQPLLTASKAGDNKVNSLLSKYGIKVQETEEMDRSGYFALPGVGKVEALEKDAFAEDSPIFKKAKAYNQAGGTLVAMVSEAHHADLSQFDEKTKDALRNELAQSKAGRFGEWHRELTQNAKVVKNPNVVRPVQQ